MASHQFNGIEAVPMTAACIQRQVPRLASLPTNGDRDSTPIIRAVISVAGMVWLDLLAHLDQAQPHTVVVIRGPRVCKRMSYEKILNIPVPKMYGFMFKLENVVETLGGLL